MTGTLSLQLLGLPRVWVDGAVQDLPTRKLLALLTYLALRGSVTRAEVVTLLWGAHTSAVGRRNLRQELHRLRTTPLAAWLLAEEDRLQLKVGFDLDVERWRVDLALPETDVTTGPPTLLDGLDIKAADEFADWLQQERDVLRRLWAAEAARRATRCEQDGDLANALRHLQAQLTQQPLDESLHRRVMQLLHRQGERAAALEQFQRCKQLLQQELQVAPDAETLALEQRIRDTAVQFTEAATAATGPLHAPLIGRDVPWSRLRASGARVC